VVAVTAREANGTGSERKLVIEVRDNAPHPGTQQAPPEQWFDVLYTDNARRGTGFGLPIAKRIVTDHHGDIAIRTGDTGTVVALTLPVA
jgi:signal transduction histidine kinase